MSLPLSSPHPLDSLVQIRGLPVDEAIQQMMFSPKKAASAVRQVLTITKNNARTHHGAQDTSNFYVAESYVGRVGCVELFRSESCCLLSASSID